MSILVGGKAHALIAASFFQEINATGSSLYFAPRGKAAQQFSRYES